MSDRRGASLLIVLAGAVILSSLLLAALHAAMVRARLAADVRWQVEGELVVSSALALTRVNSAPLLDTLSDGNSAATALFTRPDQWEWQATISRTGALIRIVAMARYRATDGALHAARRASLMLARSPADTVRVSGQHPRF